MIKNIHTLIFKTINHTEYFQYKIYKVRKVLCNQVLNSCIKCNKKLPGLLTELVARVRTCGCKTGSGSETGGIDMDTAATPFGFRKMKEIQL